MLVHYPLPPSIGGRGWLARLCVSVCLLVAHFSPTSLALLESVRREYMQNCMKVLIEFAVN